MTLPDISASPDSPEPDRGLGADAAIAELATHALYRYRHVGGIEGLGSILRQSAYMQRDTFARTVAGRFADTLLAPAFDRVLAETAGNHIWSVDAYEAVSERVLALHDFRYRSPQVPVFTLGQSAPLLRRFTGYDFQATQHIQEFYVPLPDDGVVLECFRGEWLYHIDASGRRANRQTDRADATLRTYQFEVLRADARRRAIGFASLRLFDGRWLAMGFIPEPFPLRSFDQVEDIAMLDAVTAPDWQLRCRVLVPPHRPGA